MYSQAGQDEFVYLLTNKNPGFFLDIGAGDGFDRPNGGNSQFLEENGWNGILIECNEEFYSFGKERRSSTFINARIPDVSILDILDNNNSPKTIDYVSMDIEPSNLIALKTFPFKEYEFKILTFEHDLYMLGPQQKIESQIILKDLGYICLCDNVKIDGLTFEDWWINPKYFNSNFIQNNTFREKEYTDIINKLKEKYE